MCVVAPKELSSEQLISESPPADVRVRFFGHRVNLDKESAAKEIKTKKAHLAARRETNLQRFFSTLFWRAAAKFSTMRDAKALFLRSSGVST